MNENRFFTKARLIYLCISTVSLIIAAILLITIRIQSGALPSQLAADRWTSDDESFAQISAFISPDASVTDDSILQIVSTVESKLKEASLMPEDDNIRAWIYSSSTEADIQISTSRASVNTCVTGVDGEYFMFHPLKLLSGYYFTGTDLSYDRIVIDEDLAWQLFGSFDVDGMEVRINEKPYIIAAVIQKDTDKASLSVYGDSPRAYISYLALSDIMGEPQSITCFEAVLPDPISKFAYNMLSESIGIGDKLVEVKENSSRYNIISLLSNIKTFSRLSVRQNAIVLPFWENAARIIEIRLTILFFFAIILILPFVSFVISSSVSLWRRRKWRLADIKARIIDYFEEQSIKRYEKKQKIKERIDIDENT